jgi:hypothetical protein
VLLVVWTPIALMGAYFIYLCVRKLDRRVRFAGILGFGISIFWIMFGFIYPSAFDQHRFLQILILVTWPNSFGLLGVSDNNSRLVLGTALTILTGMNVLLYLFVGWMACVAIPWIFGARPDRGEQAR